MLRDYLFFLILIPVSNALWAWWVLPEMNEQGAFSETLEWIFVQSLVPLLFGILLGRRQGYVYWFLFVYAALLVLFGVGTLGWALMGPGTPFSVYVACLLFFVIGFGLLFYSMRDLNFGRDRRKFDLEE